MSEQAQRQLAEVLIDKVERLEAENATLKQERDYHRTAHDSATIRISQLTRERDCLLADAVITDEKYAAAINALRGAVAERDRLRQDYDDDRKAYIEGLEHAAKYLRDLEGELISVDADMKLHQGTKAPSVQAGLLDGLAAALRAQPLSPSETEEAKP